MSRGKKLLLLVSLAFTAAIVVHTFLAPDGWSRRIGVARDLAAVEAENAQTSARAALLRNDVQALRTRPEVQERVVRDELGLVRKDDRVVELSRP